MLDQIKPTSFEPSIIEAATKVYEKFTQSKNAVRVAPSTSFEAPALYASAALTALLSAGSDTCRFRVILAPELFTAEDADYACEVEENEICVTLYAIPEKIFKCPVEYRAILTLYLVADAYVQTVEKEAPEHNWGVKNPARQITMDALKMKPQQLKQARQAIWN